MVGGGTVPPSASSASHDIPSRWALVWVSLHGVAVVVSMLVALNPAERLGAPLSAVLPIAVGLLAWQLAVVARRWREPRRAMPDALLVAVGAAIAVYLVARAPVFLFAAGTLFAVVYARVPLRAATLIAAPYAACLVVAVLPTLGRGFALAMGCMSGGSLLLALFIDTVVRQSTERKRLLDELAETREELHAAERRAGAMSERQRIARELHDTVTQDLVGLRLLIGEVRDARSRPADASRALEDARALVTRALGTARGLVWASHDPEPPGVARRLRELAESFRREAACDVVVSAPDDDALSPPVRLALFRVAREALANAKKHARARHITITLDVTPEEALLDVHDDGVGFEPAGLQPSGDGGFGLWSLERSIVELGGSFSVESAPGDGTTVGVRIPLVCEAEVGASSRESGVQFAPPDAAEDPIARRGRAR